MGWAVLAMREQGIKAREGGVAQGFHDAPVCFAMKAYVSAASASTCDKIDGEHEEFVRNFKRRNDARSTVREEIQKDGETETETETDRWQAQGISKEVNGAKYHRLAQTSRTGDLPHSPSTTPGLSKNMKNTAKFHQ